MTASPILNRIQRKDISHKGAKPQRRVEFPDIEEKQAFKNNWKIHFAGFLNDLRRGLIPVTDEPLLFRNDARLEALFEALNAKLQEQNVIGEIGMCGGAVMCAVFHARAATRDVDAIFAPTAEIRKAAKAIAMENDVPQDWLNDAAKGFFGALPPQMPFREWPNLRVWSPSPEYMLAMKCVAARYDTSDADDVRYLIGLLKLPPNRRTNFLRVRLPGGGSAL